jgi:hypothetical protein
MGIFLLRSMVLEMVAEEVLQGDVFIMVTKI